MRKPVIGETLYSLNIGNAARNREEKLIPVTVTRVGRKYFYIQQEGWHYEHKVEIDSWYETTNYSANFVLYENHEDWYNDKEHNRLSKLLRDTFSCYGRTTYSLDQLKTVVDILNLERGN